MPKKQRPSKAQFCFEVRHFGTFPGRMPFYSAMQNKVLQVEELVGSGRQANFTLRCAAYQGSEERKRRRNWFWPSG